jgi:CHRD domain/PEP-CTERM motif
VTANGGTTASAEAALAASMAVGEAYLNIHTTVVPGGEIRGFLTAVPEPSTFMLAVLALGLAFRRRFN